MDRNDRLADEIVELGVASEETRGVGFIEDDPGGDKQLSALGVAAD